MLNSMGVFRFRSVRVAALAAVAVLPVSPAEPPAAESPPPCRAGKSAKALDFWFGEWSVFNTRGEHVGDNRIEPALKGCAVFEHWTDAEGKQGKSLFYYNAAKDEWRQTWVTEDTRRPIGLKHMRLTEFTADGGVRFELEAVLPDGRQLVDRTTMTPCDDGTVRQLIELSFDGGESWRTLFDAVYRKTKN